MANCSKLTRDVLQLIERQKPHLTVSQIADANKPGRVVLLQYYKINNLKGEEEDVTSSVAEMTLLRMRFGRYPR